MNVHLIGSMREFDTDLRFMNKITTTVENNGGTVILNWLAGVHDRKTRGSHIEQVLNWEALVDDNMYAIAHSDVLIVEGSRYNYSQGYQTAIALTQNKPVLNLYRKDLPEYKEWPDQFFVSGVSHPLFTSKPYSTEDNLESIVTDFLKKHMKKIHELDIQITFNDEIYKEIEKLSQESNKSKASVIKDIVTRNIHNS